MPNEAFMYEDPGPPQGQEEILWQIVPSAVTISAFPSPFGGEFVRTKQPGVKPTKVLASEGVQAIRVGRIRMEAKKPKGEDFDEFVKRFSDGLPKEPFRVTWDPFDWSKGYVQWEEDPAKLYALRELQYRIINCDVKVKRGSGIRLDRKKRRVTVDVREVPLTEEERKIS